MSPADSLQFLDRYGVVILPALAVTEQIGIPLPAVPALLSVGAPAALGRMLGLVIVTALAGYILVKYGRRRLCLRKLRTAPVSPEALKRRLDAGDDVTIIDLRTALDVAATPYAIPRSRWLAADAIDEHEVELLRSRDVVLYCASPNDATSARVALQLKHKGISRVRPLEGGLAAWMALNLPVRTVQLPVAAADESSRRAEPTAA